MLTILGLLKSNSIANLYGSDIDAKSLKLAEDNLSLLTGSGIRKRRGEIEALYDKYEKESHREALISVDRIEKLLTKEIKANVFPRNALQTSDLPFIPDIIITDVPYGNLVEWDDSSKGVNQLMNVVSSVCGKDTIVCICMDKKQKIQTDLFHRLEKQVIGKRKFEIYQKITDIR